MTPKTDRPSVEPPQDWQTGKPPNEQLVEVEWEGRIIRVLAFYGRDGYRPHWRSEDDDTHFAPGAFSRWRSVEPFGMIR